jgi:hypothetical protein
MHFFPLTSVILLLLLGCGVSIEVTRPLVVTDGEADYRHEETTRAHSLRATGGATGGAVMGPLS